MTLLEAALQSDPRLTRGTPKQLLNSQETRFITTRLRPSLFSVCGGRILWTREPYHPEQDCQQTLSLFHEGQTARQGNRLCSGGSRGSRAACVEHTTSRGVFMASTALPAPGAAFLLYLPPARSQDCVGTVQQPERHCVCSLAVTNTMCVISSVSLPNSILT